MSVKYKKTKVVLACLLIFNSYAGVSVGALDFEDIKQSEAKELYRLLKPTREVVSCSSNNIGMFLAFGLTLFIGGKVSSSRHCTTKTVEVSFNEWKNRFNKQVGRKLIYGEKQSLLITDKLASEIINSPLVTAFSMKMESLEVTQGNTEKSCLLLSDSLLKESTEDKRLMEVHFTNERERIESMEEIIAREKGISVNELRLEMRDKSKVPQFTIDYQSLQSKFDYSLDEEIIFNELISKYCENIENKDKKKLLTSIFSRSELSEFYKEYIQAMVVFKDYRVILINDQLLSLKQDDVGKTFEKRESLGSVETQERNRSFIYHRSRSR